MFPTVYVAQFAGTISVEVVYEMAENSACRDYREIGTNLDVDILFEKNYLRAG